MADPLITVSAIERRLAGSLHPITTSGSSLPVQGYRPAGNAWRPLPAAVLVAILAAGGAPRVVLTVRSPALAAHPGQVSLPGGGAVADEAFPLGTALREANEEIMLPAEHVRALGLLDRFDTITGYRITPVVGLVESAVDLVPDPSEVLEVLSVPLEQVLDPASYRHHAINRSGECFEVWSMVSGHRPVWGATAAILRELALCAQPVEQVGQRAG